MVVLALDTTTRAGSCALLRDGAVVAQTEGDAARPHDARLPGDLIALVDRAGVELADVDVFAVATGPGSFTGLRIGIATMQGLAFAARQPLVGVSALAALAALTPGARVATWIDAWRGEIYAALYADGRETEAPSVELPAAVLDRLPVGTVVVGDGAVVHAGAIQARPGVRIAEPAVPPLAGAIARLALDAATGGALPPPHAIRPLYVRRPDAERSRHARPVR